MIRSLLGGCTDAQNQSPPILKYRKQKTQHDDRAFVELNGKRNYLGPYDSAENRAEYHPVLTVSRFDGGSDFQRRKLFRIQLGPLAVRHKQECYTRFMGLNGSQHGFLRRERRKLEDRLDDVFEGVHLIVVEQDLVGRELLGLLRGSGLFRGRRRGKTGTRLLIAFDGLLCLLL